jgi:undecaprenyl diphosphate synthase
MDLRSQIDVGRLPKHIAIIMDGNGRWAKEHNMPRVFGHRSGVKAVREATEAAAEIGIDYLTLYAFSTENWRRPKYEVGALMKLLVDTLDKEVKTLNKNNIRLQAIGDIERLPAQTLVALRKGIESTRNNDRMTLVLALNYSSKWEILEATRKIAADACDGIIKPEDIDQEVFGNALSTRGIPDPELLIRTSGESRISNFLLWQIAYSELCFMPVYWPDFDKNKFYEAIIDYQSRERRFGKTSEQLKS